MRLEGAPESGNVTDSRGLGGGLAVGGGIGGILLLVLSLLLGTNLVDIGGRRAAGPSAPPDEKTLVFTKRVLGTTEEVWAEEFRKQGKRYRPPRLELFTSQVRSGCGVAPASVGPFYCPADEKIYIDPTFFDDLERQLGGSKGDFSKAYVIAHEVGHHVQRLLGFTARHDDNQASVRLELQADYLAGVWAHHGQKKFNFIEPGDVDEAIKSAKAIGDDRIQKRSGGFVHPEKFTHGTSRQRVYFFTRGLKSGDASMATLQKFFAVPMNRNGEIQDF